MGPGGSGATTVINVDYELQLRPFNLILILNYYLQISLDMPLSTIKVFLRFTLFDNYKIVHISDELT